MLRSTIVTSVIALAFLACQRDPSTLFGPDHGSASGGSQQNEPGDDGSAGSSDGDDGAAASANEPGNGNGTGASGGRKGHGDDGSDSGGEAPDGTSGAPNEETPGTGGSGNAGTGSAGTGGSGNLGSCGNRAGNGGTGHGASNGCGKCGGCPSQAGGGQGGGAESGGTSGAVSSGGTAEMGEAGASNGGSSDAGSGTGGRSDPGAAGAAGDGSSEPNEPPIFSESCAPPPDPEPPIDYACDYACGSEPYYAVIVDASRTLGPLMRNDARGINNAGQVAGTWNPGSDLEEWDPWLWEDGATVSIGAIAMANGFGEAINEAGTVFGRLILGAQSRYFLYGSGGVEILPDTLSARGLNGRGDVVGTNATGAVLRADGEFVELGAFIGRGSTGEDINDRREVVGSAEFGEFTDRHAYLYSCGETTDLGTLGGPSSVAYDINGHGQIAGVSTDPSGQNLVFSYQGGVMRGLFPHNATSRLAINERGEVVNGGHLVSGENVYVLKDLVMHESCWVLLQGNDINDQGDIAGWGRLCENPGELAPAVVITKHPERYR